MIIGLGNDITDIRRIEQSLKHYGKRFEERIFTAQEQSKAKSRKDKAATYAKRFAAKEACAKALGTGVGKSLAWCEMEVTNLASGAPTLTLHGKAKKLLQRLTPADHTAQILLTLSDEYPYAQAIVIIQAIPSA
ncbi:MAG: holo-ACP synthase [Rickettsiales bacterium]|nr:holo-ACP synthase [Rickettsiales bacterium]